MWSPRREQLRYCRYGSRRDSGDMFFKMLLKEQCGDRGLMSALVGSP